MGLSHYSDRDSERKGVVTQYVYDFSLVLINGELHVVYGVNGNGHSTHKVRVETKPGEDVMKVGCLTVANDAFEKLIEAYHKGKKNPTVEAVFRHGKR